MDLLQLSVSDVQKLILILSRVSAILFFAPVLDNPILPTTFKIGMSLVFSMMLFPLVSFDYVIQSSLVMAVFMAKEIVVGLMIGLTVNLVFAAVRLAGQVTGFQMGLGIVSIMDPFTSTQTSVVTQFYSFVTILLFFAFDAHHIIIRAVGESFHVLPFGPFQVSAPLLEVVLDLAGQMFVMALKIGVPVIAINFFVSVGLALLARTVPQMNVFIVSFPLKIAVGLVAVGLSLPFVATLLRKSFSESEGYVHALLRAL